MSQDKNKIKNNLLRKLSENNLTSAELEWLLNESRNDPFLKESLEGWNQYLNFPQPTQSKNIFNNGLIVSSIVMISMICLSFFFNKTETKTKELPAQAKIKKPLFTAEEKKPHNKNDNNQADKPVSESIQQKVKNNFQTNQNASENYDKRELKTISQKEILFPFKNQISDKKLKPVSFNCRIKEYKGHLLVDYLALNRYTHRSEDEKTTQFAETEKQTTLTIDFEKLLKDGIDAFDKADRESALKKFSLILEHFPDDANATYYLGLLEYLHADRKYAKKHFEKSMRNSCDLFLQPSAYYLAIIAISEGRQDEAKDIIEFALSVPGNHVKQLEELLIKMKQ